MSSEKEYLEIQALTRFRIARQILCEISPEVLRVHNDREEYEQIMRSIDMLVDHAYGVVRERERLKNGRDWRDLPPAPFLLNRNWQRKS